MTNENLAKNSLEETKYYSYSYNDKIIKVK